MTDDKRENVTELLGGLQGRDIAEIADKLLPLVYDDLRELAAKFFRRERRDHTLQPTALVHEAYLRLVDQARVDWRGRTHFCAICARIMRQVLVDHARGRRRQRRGGDRERVILDSQVVPIDLEHVDLLDLHDALQRLAQLDERQAQVVELRFFGGLSVDEVADFLNVSKRTVEGDWTHAKAWLRAELDRGA